MKLADWHFPVPAAGGFVAREVMQECLQPKLLQYPKKNDVTGSICPLSTLTKEHRMGEEGEQQNGLQQGSPSIK